MAAMAIVAERGGHLLLVLNVILGHDDNIILL